MLRQLNIRNLVIVDHLELEFQAGMTVLSGETGAGKSILLNALGLCLGERGGQELIRAGQKRAEVSALFELNDLPEVSAWLQEQALDSGDECWIRRILEVDKRARAFVNGSPVSQDQLQRLGEMLVDIHGQHAHQSLLKTRHQRELLDGFAAAAAQLAACAGAFQAWKQARQQWQRLRQDSHERQQRLDLLRFQIQELRALHWQAGEFTRLEDDQRRLGHLDRIIELATELTGELYDNDRSVQERLSGLIGSATELTQLDARNQDALNLLESALIQIEEAANALRDYRHHLDHDPGLLAQVEERLGEILGLARKYHCEPEILGERLHALEAELANLENLDNNLEWLEQESQRREQELIHQARVLHTLRISAAERLSAEVTASIRTLGMNAGDFQVRIQELPLDKAQASGLDEIEFLVTANPGQPLQPLAKVASGGELSRISLAIQVVTAAMLAVPTLVYDEVDVGVGGSVAATVGRLLRTLGQQRQVLCITHLPQVAACGHQHFSVRKEIHDEHTFSHIMSLDAHARIDELARMLGGSLITETTRAHALEMLEQGATP